MVNWEVIVCAIITLILSIFNIYVHYKKRNVQQRRSINLQYNGYMILFVVVTLIMVFAPTIDETLLTELIGRLYYNFCGALPYIIEFLMGMTDLLTLFGIYNMLISVTSVFPKYQMNKWVHMTITVVFHVPYTILYVHETTCDTSSCWIPSPYLIIIKYLRPVMSYTICSIVMLLLAAFRFYRRKPLAVCGVKQNKTKTIMLFTTMAIMLTMRILLHVLWLTTNVMTLHQYNILMGLYTSLVHFHWSVYIFWKKGIFTSSTDASSERFRLNLNRTDTSATMSLPDIESQV